MVDIFLLETLSGCLRSLLYTLLTCHRVLRTYVLTYQRVHALRVLRAHVPTCLVYFACERAHVL